MDVTLQVFAVVVVASVAASATLGWLDVRKRQRQARAYAARSVSDQVLKARVARQAQPTVMLTPAQAPGFSKLGGSAELPKGWAWPQGHTGPRPFLAQIDLAALHSHALFEWLPPDGRLYAFLDHDRQSFADAVQVLYSRGPPAAAQPLPANLSPGNRFKERRIGFAPFTSLPTFEWLGLQPTNPDLTEEAIYASLGFPDEPLIAEVQHRIGGYPSEIQSGQLARECEHLRRGMALDYGDEIPETIRRAARQWRLLLQIDSDDALGMEWGDGGRLYVFVREKDARAADFSQTITISQSH